MTDLPRLVLGIDPSLTGTGLASIDTHTFAVRTALVTTRGAEQMTLLEQLDRLGAAMRGIAEFVPVERTLVVIEAPSFGSFSTSAHERAGLWWRTVAYLHHRGHHIARVTPRTRSKYIAGHLAVKNPRKGPDKREIVAALRGEHPELGIRNDNIADGFGLACMGARFLGAPIDSFTTQRVEAVAAVKWPPITVPEGNTP